MKKKIKTLKIVALSLVLGLVVNLAIPIFVNNSSQAWGDLVVVGDELPIGFPILVFNNMLPGTRKVEMYRLTMAGLLPV